MTRLRIFRVLSGREPGVSLLETVVALFVLGTVAVTFLSGLVTTSRAAFLADEQATAESLAKSQMEWAKKASYTPGATSYAAATLPTGKDYMNYSATISAQPHDPDDGIQKITVTVSRSGEVIIRLEGYKVNRGE